MSWPRRSRPREMRPRPGEQAKAPEGTVNKRTQSTEEYLEAIFKLQRGDAPLTVKHLADDLGTGRDARRARDHAHP